MNYKDPVLYSAYSIEKELKGYANVQIDWFYDEKRSCHVVPYDYAVANYERLSPDEKTWVKGMIDELFTFDEIIELHRFIVANWGLSNFHVERVELPISEVYYPTSWLPLGGGRDAVISRNSKNPLPFRFIGQYDLRHFDQLSDSILKQPASEI